VAAEKIRLGGMALPNGVLVHGPTSWACAVRLTSGELKVETGAKRFRASTVDRPLLRGPARIGELFALLPQVRRSVPEAKLPFERREVLAGVVASAAAVRLVRGSKRLGPVSQEFLSGLLSIAPAALALRSSELAAYHGAEHVSIGTYEHGAQREKEHERCGGHLVGPLIATNAIGGALANRAPERWRSPARAAATVAALAASTEIFVWMTKNPEHKLSKVLGRPGHELQHRLSTAEPSASQLEVAEAALRACLALEHAAAGTTE
jgi:uncharacterized protein YqhQ